MVSGLTGKSKSSSVRDGQSHSLQLETHFVEQEELFPVPMQPSRIQHAPADQKCGAKR
jgi:hypothetical protein